MGTGGILSKKSWHVGNRQNRERVLRDEQAANASELERREKEVRREKERLHEHLRSGVGVMARGEKDGGERGEGEAGPREGRVGTEDARLDVGYRLGGSAGGRGVPWYARGKDDGVGRSTERETEPREETRGGERKHPSFLGAVVVGKAKKLSKKDRRRAEKEKLLALRAAREQREKAERERMHKTLLHRR